MCNCHDLGDYKDLFRDGDILCRRVRKDHIVEGKVTAAHCPTKQWAEGLSCDWSVMANPRDSAEGHPYLLTFTVGQCTALDIGVRYCPHHDPTSTFYNLAHCLLVLPQRMNKRAIAEVRRRFLKVAVLRSTESYGFH